MLKERQLMKEDLDHLIKVATEAALRIQVNLELVNARCEARRLLKS